MIRALRQLFGRRHARGGQVGPPPSEAIWAEVNPHEDQTLDPDDPIVRLVRQARAVGDGRIVHYLGDDTTTCPTCRQNTQRPVFAHSLSVSHEYAIRIATRCPNCPPEEDS